MVAANVRGSADIIGVVKEHEGIGNRFPAFHIGIEGRIMPVVLMFEDDPGFVYRSLGCNINTYFQEEWRRNLASVYRAICEKQKWKLDDFCTYNVVYWLEKKGFHEITNENLQEAYALIKEVRELFYTYVDQMELTQEELQRRPVLN